MSYAPLVEKVVKAVVENADEVRITESMNGNERRFEVTCAKEDVGKVIGKSGRVISAIRQVVSAVASKERERAYVRVDAD